MAIYHMFKGTTGTQTVLTPDKTGANLPPRQFGSWRYLKQVDLSVGDVKNGPPAEVVEAAISKDGYFLVPGEVIAVNINPPKAVL